jgi:MoaA/NifB/PqqE/SkfB family radical SAM enzyme
VPLNRKVLTECCYIYSMFQVLEWLKFKRQRSAAQTSANELSEAVINAYNRTRTVSNKHLLCHAPFSNMYFNTEGDVALCWKTFHKAEKYTPEKSIMDIWRGANFEAIRNDIRSGGMDFACGECKKHLLEGNFVNVLSKAYDLDELHPEYPSIMEFELSNRCNLGCTMCNGLLSSTIRRDREHLPPLVSPYGEKFVEDLRPFIPHLKEARFNGGEPFLIKLYYPIWDLIFELNPGLKIVVATNGTVLNDKVKSYLERGNFHINLSIDGITKETYERIRIKGDFDKLMGNFDYFHQYCKERNRTLCVMINPMRDNWQEMPEFVRFCLDKNIHLWFNTIIKPSHLALWSLPPKELSEIYQSLSAERFSSLGSGTLSIRKYNIRTYENFVQQQIKTWLDEAEQREKIAKKYLETSLELYRQSLQDRFLEYEKNPLPPDLWRKVEQVVELIEEDDQKKKFYHLLSEQNQEELFNSLENHTMEEIKGLFEQYLSQH